MSQLLFVLIFSVSGVEYTLLSGVSIHTCVGRLTKERQAIAAVNTLHPELTMKVGCYQMGLPRNG